MSSPYVGLAECYVPSVVGGGTSEASVRNDDTSAATDRSMRPIHMEIGGRSNRVLSGVSGSSLLEMGHTRILCAVHGPRPSGGAADGGDPLRCEVRFAPFCKRPPARHRPAPVRGAPADEADEEELRLSDAVRGAVLPSLVGTTGAGRVFVAVTVLQCDDADPAPGCAIAASLALADAGVVELRGMVPACAVAVHEGNDGAAAMRFVVDPCATECTGARSLVVVAALPARRSVTYVEQRGQAVPLAVLREAVQTCEEGNAAVHSLMRKCVLESLEADGMEKAVI
eukprot:CAMPEP_0194282170 /NCGR_PEP_ID=MMETSP0169-20130528/22543_1 /TAXON_ID=218684 /ORGANISM="Corethron pennatum, Strain L29A3" /LENGTH=283 /DNA_ID=CAMNT_0039027419 /DNA_START=35 /DNA_END=886 /DNA_ORIENTATION=-